MPKETSKKKPKAEEKGKKKEGKEKEKVKEKAEKEKKEESEVKEKKDAKVKKRKEKLEKKPARTIFVDGPQKSKELKKIQEKIRKKKKVKFRGRFGKRNIRRKSNKKWQKWRKPRGIDIKRKKEDGAVPKTGYRTSKDIRGRHPSGYYEKIVFNMNDLNNLDNQQIAVKIASTVGKKKRLEILKKATELKLKVLNR